MLAHAEEIGASFALQDSHQRGTSTARRDHMPDRGGYSETVAVTLTPELRAVLEERARLEDRPMTATLRCALRLYLAGAGTERAPAEPRPAP